MSKARGRWKHIYAGERFGRMTVLSDYYNDKVRDNHHYCHCKCDCGNEFDVSTLWIKHKTSCGRCKEREMVGKKFGRLTVMSTFYKYNNKSRVLFARCICGCDAKTNVDVNVYHLLSGHTISCGCYNKEHPSHTTHGMSDSDFYVIWSGILCRCFNKNVPAYKNYGARGITVCDRWNDSFENFKDDMYESYNEHIKEFGKEDTSLDRIDNNGNYCKENCRWATRKEQANNTRRNHFIEYKGETKSIAEWESELGFEHRILLSRLKLGWSVSQAIETPVRKLAKKG